MYKRVLYKEDKNTCGVHGPIYENILDETSYGKNHNESLEDTSFCLSIYYIPSLLNT
jgi:hypothetical protein